MKERFDELVGPIEDPDEHDRLRRVHQLLLSVDPPPEVSPALQAPIPAEPVQRLPRRRRTALALLAAALAAAAFGAGWFANERSGDVEAVALIPMTGTAQARGATALIELLPQDESGNWPMNVRVRGLTPSRDRSDYYESHSQCPVWPAAVRRLGRHAARLRRAPALDQALGGRDRLPELEAVSLRIGGPAEAAEFLLRDLLVDLDTGVAQLSEHRIEVVDAEVDHHLLLERPVAGVAREERPDG